MPNMDEMVQQLADKAKEATAALPPVRVVQVVNKVDTIVTAGIYTGFALAGVALGTVIHEGIKGAMHPGPKKV